SVQVARRSSASEVGTAPTGRMAAPVRTIIASGDDLAADPGRRPSDVRIAGVPMMDQRARVHGCWADVPRLDGRGPGYEAAPRSAPTGSFTPGAFRPVSSAIVSKRPFTVTFSPARM